MRRKSLLWQLFPPYLLIILVCVILVSWSASRSLRGFYLERTAADLQARAALLQEPFAARLAAGATDSIQALCRRQGLSTGTRITVVARDGTVLGDSQEDPSRMENHANRPEIRNALAGGRGTSIRYSHTLEQEMMYVAVPLGQGTPPPAVLRTSISLASIQRALRVVYLDILLAGLVLALAAALVSYLVARRISHPLQVLKRGAERFASCDLDLQLAVPDSEEIGALAEAMNRMAAQLDDRIRTVDQQRRELEAVLASMVEGVLAIDADERVIGLNRAAARLLDADSESAAGRDVREVVRNPDLLRLIQRALAGDSPVEGDVILYGERELYLQAHATGLRGGADGRIGALVVLNDVTRLRRLENVRRDFVANVSHELKTPITSIRGFVETLQGGALDDPADARRFLQIVGDQANRLGAIVEDLLTLSRLEQEAGPEGLNLAKTSVGEALHHAVAACSSAAAERNIHVDVACPADLKASFSDVLLEQAVANLVDNAVKYSEPGGRVEVSARESADGLEISVRDQGCGIAREHLPRIFERFYRVDKARSRKLGGTGLGLAIVKHIAQAHGGEVEVKSRPGEGSIFTIRLPHF
jgi:two-component system phosphate regulon sensor histidine kinase PhoR